MSNVLASIINGYTPKTQRGAKITTVAENAKSKTPTFRMSPVQFERIRHDVQMWREAISEAENSFYPQRVRMQRIYQDTILNDHVDACIKKRKTLTLLRKFKICDDGGNENEEITKIFKKSWFRNFQSYAIDATLHGYNLISLGDLINDTFPKLSFVKRQNVSPDRMIVAPFVYSLTGEKFLEAPFKDWFIYISTPTETGSSPCGYGLLYKIARTEILLRNNLGQNADYNEVFGQPIRKGTTTKQGLERDVFEDALKTMGANPYIILDDGQDDLELIAGSGTGQAYQTFDNLEARLEKKISKVILGHADAIDSTPGKLGGGQAGDSPVDQALHSIQSDDAEYMLPLINDELIPRMRILGINIPDNLHFEYMNDEEVEEFRKRVDESNSVTATIAQTMSNAGLEMDAKYFEDRTGIPTKRPPPPKPPAPPEGAGQPFGAKKPNPAILNLISSISDYMEENDSWIDVPRHPAGTHEGGQWAGGHSSSAPTVIEIPQKIVRAIDKANVALYETGGFSLTDIGKLLSERGRTSKEPHGNYIVSLGGFEKKIPLKTFDKYAIVDYLTEHKSKFSKEHDLILGGWHNKADGIVYLDISKSFKSKAEAIKFGKMSKQIAGWDAKNNKEFQITRQVVKNDLNEELTPEERAERFRAMYGSMISVLDEDDNTELQNPANESAD